MFHKWGSLLAVAMQRFLWWKIYSRIGRTKFARQFCHANSHPRVECALPFRVIVATKLRFIFHLSMSSWCIVRSWFAHLSAFLHRPELPTRSQHVLLREYDLHYKESGLFAPICPTFPPSAMLTNTSPYSPLRCKPHMLTDIHFILYSEARTKSAVLDTRLQFLR